LRRHRHRESITIDCHTVFGSILNPGTNGITVNYDAFASTDTQKTVRLRNLNFNGINTDIIGVRIVGSNTSGSAVFIEDCVIDGNFGGTARGISDERSGGGELYVTNTTVRNTGSTGIAIVPASGSTAINASINNVHVQNSFFGMAIGNGVIATVNESVFSGNNRAASKRMPRRRWCAPSRRAPRACARHSQPSTASGRSRRTRI